MKLPRRILIFAVVALPGMMACTSWGAEPAEGRNYYSVQLLSAKSAAALQEPLARVAHEPHARIDQRGSDYALRVGLWESRAEAEQGLEALRQAFRSAYVRTVTYRFHSIVLAEEKPARASASLPAIATDPALAQPPALKQEAEISLQITQAITRKDWKGVTALAQQHPGQFVCGQITFMQGLAEAYHALGNAGEAVAAYERIIPSCPRTADRIATLQQASAVLTAEAFAELLQRELQGGSRDAEQQARVEQITYEHHLRRFLQAVQAKDLTRAIGLIGNLEAALKERRDARNAALAGWVYFDVGGIGLAATWFGTALTWEPALEDARYGFALAHFRLGRLDDAEAALRQARAGDPRNRALQDDILFARAMQAYEDKDFKRSLEYLGKIDVQSRSEREIAILRAWNAYQLGDYPEAARLFIGLYRDRPDSDIAEGAVLSLSRSQRWDELAELARSLGGPLEERWKKALAQRNYDR